MERISQAAKAFVKQTLTGTLPKIPTERNSHYMRFPPRATRLSWDFALDISKSTGCNAETSSGMHSQTQTDETMVLQCINACGSEAVIVGTLCSTDCAIRIGLCWSGSRHTSSFSKTLRPQLRQVMRGFSFLTHQAC